MQVGTAQQELGGPQPGDLDKADSDEDEEDDHKACEITIAQAVSYAEQLENFAFISPGFFCAEQILALVNMRCELQRKQGAGCYKPAENNPAAPGCALSACASLVTDASKRASEISGNVASGLVAAEALLHLGCPTSAKMLITSAHAVMDFATLRHRVRVNSKHPNKYDFTVVNAHQKPQM
jgi:hypothetical protein